MDHPFYDLRKLAESLPDVPAPTFDAEAAHREAVTVALAKAREGDADAKRYLIEVLVSEAREHGVSFETSDPEETERLGQAVEVLKAQIMEVL